MITYITVDSTITGVGKYAYDMYNLLKPDSEIVQVLFDKKYSDVNYKKPVNGSSYTIVNYLFSGFLYKNTINMINSRENIIHITSQTMKPIFKANHMVVTVHDILATQKHSNKDSIINTLKKRYLRNYLKSYIKYENILTISNYVKTGILNTFNIDEKKITVINPYVPNYFYYINGKSQLRSKLGLPLDKKLILSISSDQPRKNLGMVKNVMQSLDNDFKLVRIGPQVGDSITFNNVDPETINDIYNACDVLYFPTLMEGFGYPVVEAFKTGLPVVSSDIDVIREISSDAALLVNPNDLKENISAIKYVLDNKENFIGKGRIVAEKYSPCFIRHRLVNYYNSILKGSVRDKTN